MRPAILLAIALSVPSAAPPQPPPDFEVAVDRRIELLAIIARLADFPMFNTRTLGAHAGAIDAHFGRFRDHPAVTEAKRLQAERSFGFDAVMNFAVHLSPFPELKPRRPFEGAHLERLTPDDARRFAPLVAAFARDTDAARFFSERQPVFDAAVRRMRAVFDTEVERGWFEAFFGGPRTKGVLAVALNNGQVAYGTRYVGVNGEREMYAVINVLQLDEDGLPVLSAAFAPTIVHEFNHSFVNPVVEKHLDSLRGAAEILMKAVQAQMQRLMYTEERTLISESLVRAAVARYKRQTLGESAARAEVTRQALQGFMWMDDLYALLGRYEAERAQYPDFESFFPEIARFYNELPGRLPSVVEAFEARRPRLVDMTPPNGATDVDPATTSLRFRFDRPMRWSWAVIPASKDLGPEITQQAWDETKTVFTMSVKLQPGKTYEFSLNTAAVSGFFSEEGMPLAPVAVKFTTRGGGSHPLACALLGDPPVHVALERRQGHRAD